MRESRHVALEVGHRRTEDERLIVDDRHDRLHDGLANHAMLGTKIEQGNGHAAAWRRRTVGRNCATEQPLKITVGMREVNAISAAGTAVFAGWA